MRGGVRVVGAAMVQFIGGIYESNEPWGFVIDSPYWATRAITISGIYAEANGASALVGGAFYIGHAVTSVKIVNSWLSAGTGLANATNYLFCNNGSIDPALGLGNAELILRDNFQYCPGDSCVEFYGSSYAPSVQLVSYVVGDIGGSGQRTRIRLMTASDDGIYMVSGMVHVARTGQVKGYHGSHPFMVSRDITLRSLEIGPSVMPSGTNVTLEFVACMAGATDLECLELTFAEYEYGYVTMNEQVVVPAARFAVNTTWFRTSGMRRV